MTRQLMTLLVLACVVACDFRSRSVFDDHVLAARTLTDEYARSRLTKWNLRVHAAGHDCTILFVETPMVLEDSLIEALHYGNGTYRLHNGGIDAFCRRHAFRGTAYRDRSGRIWTFGEIRDSEAATLKRCH